MTDQILLLCFFEGDPDEVHTFTDVTAANHFAAGVFCGAAAYGCGSVEVYIRNADGSIFDAGDEDEEIKPKRLAHVKALFVAADGAKWSRRETPADPFQEVVT